MGGGDLNMKKSWHPLLLKNQERVWLEEKKALEEKKKLDQLRKEKEEERQLQELQRLQEEQTGKKRQEKLEWMYATPATGSGANANELEDYLLGKKRVDKILIAGENERVGAAHKSFIATQYANTARDTASKIREDPLLAIKQQEQAAYQTLMSNPLRLREMQERTGIKPKKDKKEKKKHKKDKHRDRSASPRSDRHRSPSLHRHRSSRHSQSPRRRDSRSRSPRRGLRHDYDRYDRDSRRGYSRSPGPSRKGGRSMSPRDRFNGRRADSHVPTWPKSDDSDDNTRRGRERSRSPEFRSRDRHDDDRKRRYSPSPRRDTDYKRSRQTPPPPRRSYGEDNQKPAANAGEDRAARLAAMSANASEMSVERREHLTKLLEKEKAELEVEEAVRAKNKGMGSFLSHEQKKVFGGTGGLEERIRRGRGQMHVDAD